MNIAGIKYDVMNAYDGTAIEIYVSGCRRNCPGCHSPELQDYSFGRKIDGQYLIEMISSIRDNIEFTDIISFLGGDPLQQDSDQFRRFVGLIQYLFPKQKYWLFTGEDSEENIPRWVWTSFDAVKIGSFQQELYNTGFPASSNQKVMRKGVDYDKHSHLLKKCKNPTRYSKYP